MRRPNLRAYLGQSVAIVIDRPLGSVHPRHSDLRYPVNYGYLPGTVSGDGHPIDVYLLGVEEPMAEATAVVIAVVLRADDVEDKLVAAPAGRHFTVKEIEALVAVLEQYFESSIVTMAR